MTACSAGSIIRPYVAVVVRIKGWRLTMALTPDSTISEVLNSRPDAREIVVKHAGMPIDESLLAMAMGMSLRQVAGFVCWSSDKVDALVAALNEP